MTKKLTRLQEQRIAKCVADEMMGRIYEEIGKSILKKVFWLGISALIALAVSSTNVLHFFKAPE